MVLLALARPVVPGSRAGLATRLFGWTTLVTASALGVAEWGRAQGPPSAVVMTGCALAAAGAILFLALRREFPAPEGRVAEDRGQTSSGNMIGAVALVLVGDAIIVASSRAGDPPARIMGLVVGLVLFGLAALRLRRRARGSPQVRGG
jgi:hypothetical protein